MASRHTTTLPSHIRPSSGFALNHQSSTSSTANLQARINEKRLELESLKQLRDLSAGLAGQMQQLEEKLSTLSDGTEAVALVMGNWSTVLRAVFMASSKISRPKDGEDEGEEDVKKEEPMLPQTLVRIPIQQAEAAKAQVEAEGAEGG